MKKEVIVNAATLEEAKEIACSKLQVSDDDINDNNLPGRDWLGDALSSAPIWGSALGLALALSNKAKGPNFKNFADAEKTIGSIGDVTSERIGDYMKYKPSDKMYLVNQLNPNTAANRRFILNSSGGNRGTAIAGLLANDATAQNAIANAFYKGDDVNWGRYKDTANFNRGTNIFNAEQTNKVALANMSNRAAKGNLQLKLGAYKEAIEKGLQDAVAANLTSLFNNIGELGKYLTNKRNAAFWLNSQAPLPIDEFSRLFGKKAARRELKRRKKLESEMEG